MRILIVEDDSRIAKLISRGLEENDFETTIAYDGMQAITLLRQISFDLLITDIILPQMDGVDLCKQIRNVNQDIPVLMLSALGEIDNKMRGFDAGADDYIVKPFELRELVARIRVLLKRNSNAGKSMGSTLVYDDLTLCLDSKIVKRNEQNINLTPKEFKLLEYMLRNAERVLSRNEIAENVWKIAHDTGTNFIDVYINYLRKKIDKEFDRKLIHTRAGLGFILSKD
ncbi:response regulator transcription factor [Flavobacterium hercynium]|uniref:DNA-binding response regulator n=1 Tax=Flavobacterium hercynium TaxID=387094 RepID=A0A226GZA0_9FLAO|nr:response regulator transcription factor [Flavobacterium hercynium]OXA87343.1 DNA-binding response regulator [Flavobacterium hercynium]SMP27126.1 DNA-binding response regulator, OmpR family, contains REC and winged-helix (wHTH) domain [Flavobacterium hercynium]